MADASNEILARLIANPLYSKAGVGDAPAGGAMGAQGGAVSPTMLKMIADQIDKQKANADPTKGFIPGMSMEPSGLPANLLPGTGGGLAGFFGMGSGP